MSTRELFIPPSESARGSVAGISKSCREWLGECVTPTRQADASPLFRAPVARIREVASERPAESPVSQLSVSSPEPNPKSPSKEGSGEDPEAPFPTPLHIIQGLTPGGDRHLQKAKRSTRTWELSDLEGDNSRKYSPAEKRDDAEGASVIPDSPGFVEGSSLTELATSLGEWCAGLPKATVPAALETQALNDISPNVEFDPTTGLLLPQVFYPDTHINLVSGPCRDAEDIAWRQANMTSELQIVREIKARERIATELRVKLRQHKVKSTPPPKEVSWPNAQCVLRPAVRSDLPQVLEVIQLESKESACPSIIETPTDLESVERIFAYCQENSRPFIVAIPTNGPDMLDRSKWPKDAEEHYQEFCRFHQMRQTKDAPPIVGFAFITEARLGFSGSHCIGSRFSGAIKLLVHPHHRRKLYGTALLDRILQCVASYSHSLVDYKWVCKETKGVYENPTIRNRRKYVRVYIDTVVEGEDDPNLVWITKLMEKFEFKRVGYFRQTMRTLHGPNNKWLDLVVWDLEARPSEDIKG